MPSPHPCFALATAMVMAPAAAGAGGTGAGAPASAGGAEPGAARAPIVRLHGAASVVDALVKPHAAAVEKATGAQLAIDRSNAGKGLKDLVEGRCDLALASASLEATLDAARTAGLAAVPPDLRMHVVATSEVVFVVHPSNPVRR
ncbi:MAG TPA: substrate-binding domain-containing protein, partial [Anaeromyxobacter sp.]